MKSRRAKACDISKKVKDRVWERDGGKCIICGNHQAMPNSHFIRRSQGGLGIEENILTLDWECHQKFDQSTERPKMKAFFQEYLLSKYPDWDEEKLIYKKEY